jgi:hypothetical protein
LLHGLYYNRHNPSNVSNVEVTEKKILEYYNKFNNINLFLQRGDFEYEQAGRIQNEKEAYHVDSELRNILNSYNIPYTEFKSSEESISDMIEFLIKGAKRP